MKKIIIFLSIISFIISCGSKFEEEKIKSDVRACKDRCMYPAFVVIGLYSNIDSVKCFPLEYALEKLPYQSFMLYFNSLPKMCKNKYKYNDNIHRSYDYNKLPFYPEKEDLYKKRRVL